MLGEVGEVASAFAELMWRVVPYFAVGVVAAAVLKAFVPQTWAERVFGRGRKTSLPAAVAAGALLPGCSCTTMPMASGLRRSEGPALGTIAAFIFVSPLLSPITVVLTAVLLGWRMTTARVVASLIGSLVLGAFLNAFEHRFAAHTALAPISGGSQPVLADTAECCDLQIETSRRSKSALFVATLWQTIREIGPHFLVGMAAAAVLTALLPESAIPRSLGDAAGPAAYALAVLVGIPMYVCEGEEVPITYALLGAGLGTGPAFAFLLGSVGTCVPTILMSRSIIGTRATVFYAGFWIAFAVMSGVVVQMLLGS